MKDLVLYIVKSIVGSPDDVSVEEQTQPGSVTLVLTVHPDDMGQVIGKGGQVIKAIRKVLTVRAMADNVRVNLQLFDPNPTPREDSPSTEEVQGIEEAGQQQDPEVAQ